MFKQHVHEGFQHETPDYWLRFGNPWEIPRPDVNFQIKFFGYVTSYTDKNGGLKVQHHTKQNCLEKTLICYVCSSNGRVERLSLPLPMVWHHRIGIDAIITTTIRAVKMVGVELNRFADNPVPGFKTLNTLNIRLWSSRPSAVCCVIDYAH